MCSVQREGWLGSGWRPAKPETSCFPGVSAGLSCAVGRGRLAEGAGRLLAHGGWRRAKGALLVEGSPAFCRLVLG